MAFGISRQRCGTTGDAAWGDEDGRSVRVPMVLADRFEIEGSISGERATLVFYGEATSRCLSELDATLVEMVAREPSSLTVDLSETSSMDVATVRAIARNGRKVSHFDLRLPDAVVRPAVI